jgi:hypothetical protein
MAKNKTEQDIKSPREKVLETVRNTQANPTDDFGKKLKTGKKSLDPLNGPKEYH